MPYRRWLAGAISALVLGLLPILPGAAFAALQAADVPTFQLRARVTSCEGKAPDGKAFTFLLAGTEQADTTGDGWTKWLSFREAQAEDALKRYPNLYMKTFPVVTQLYVKGVVDPTLANVEIRFAEDGPVTTLSVDLFGPRLGLLIWREAEGLPHVSTVADYNQRYWKAFDNVAIPAAERPKLFPIGDMFDAQGDERQGWVDGLAHMGQAGFTALMIPAEPRYRDMLLKAGLHRTVGGIYNPPGYAFDFVAKPGSRMPAGWTGKPGSTTPEAIAQWARERIDPYLKAGYQPEDIAMYAMSDEPGWYFPLWTEMLQDDATGMQHFRDYLQARGLTPRELGMTSWDLVKPLGRSQAVDLPTRRLFYWTVRFFAWDSARHFANTVRAMEKAAWPTMPVFTNWGYIDRLYFPGCYGNNPDKTSPDAASGGHDWLEFGRMRGGTALWTEDWCPDAEAPIWSYYSAKLRSAAEKGGVQFGGYIVPRMAGDLEDGMLLRILTLIGSGAKALEYFTFGPEYTFPINCYSENLKVLPKIAEAHRMIGKAEELLWPGARPRAQVAILAPRSAQAWDAKDIPDTNRDLTAHTVDYYLEEYALYLALQHANIPVDFVDEDDLSIKGLKPYKVLYVTEPNIPWEGQRGLLGWVSGGGTVVTVTGAGTADRYNEPCDLLAKGLGIAEQPRERFFIADADALKESGTGTGGQFTAFGPRGALISPPKSGVTASFTDGSPAIVARKVGKGRAIHFTWMPGMSYLKSSTTARDRLPTGFSPVIRGLITAPVASANAIMPVTVDRPMIETPLLLSAKGGAVTLLNWTGEAIPRVTLVVQVPFTVQTVESIKQGALPFTQKDKIITCALPLIAADIVLLKP